MKRFRSKKSEMKLGMTSERLLAQWGVEITPSEISTCYGSTYVHVFGKVDAPPLVLFHGVADDSALMWVYNAAGLASHFRLYAVDTLGGPGKSVPNKSYDQSFDAALWIDQVLGGLKLGEVNMAGVSHGGYLVQHYTLMRTERVIKAAALASSVPVASAAQTMRMMMGIFLPEALFPTKRSIRKLLSKLTGANEAAFLDNPLIVQHFTTLLRGYNNMAMRPHKPIRFSDEQIERIKPKLLYLLGEQDPFAIRGGKQHLQHYSMNAKYFPEAGHGINHELPERINAELIQYFN